jgi:hypothetical protein
MPVKKRLRKVWVKVRRKWFGPKKLKRFRVEVDEMSNVRLTWTLPTPSNRQRPISHVAISARVSDTLPWTPIAAVDAPATELLIQDVAPGVWYYAAIVLDDRGNESQPVYADTALPYDKPSAVSGFSAAVEG